ncbi:src-like-adapter isoform X1 [Oryzias latipes]|uniref:src-like-adapter isoform X1 n=1 Tax=Oryzias latipes TaxID=8090 RepID=UPI0009D962F0|nr:src-like-adapter isoform X1 [Oryzias latipes]
MQRALNSMARWRMGNMMRAGSTRNIIQKENIDDGDVKGSEDEIVVVLEDYPSAEISEPIYKMGEKLRVIAQPKLHTWRMHRIEAYWWKVRSFATGKENYIPGSHVAKVYHGWLFEGLERKKAEELLLLPENRVGSFLVRESSSERGVYSLSVKHRMIKHYRIFRLDNSWYYISPSLTFQCLEDMINHYSDSADGLCCTLTSPCLSGRNINPGTPPVVMRRNFDWKKVDSKQLVENSDDSIVSYGVRNSIAAYLSFTAPDDSSERLDRRKRKCKSVNINHAMDHRHTESEDF